MFDVEVIRKGAKDYPGIVADLTPRFLESAAAMVQADAKFGAPVVTGTLRSSIVRRLEGNVAIVGTNVEYAPYVEYGTKRSNARPYMRPALDRNRRKIIALLASMIRSAIRA